MCIYTFIYVYFYRRQTMVVTMHLRQHFKSEVYEHSFLKRQHLFYHLEMTVSLQTYRSALSALFILTGTVTAGSNLVRLSIFQPQTARWQREMYSGAVGICEGKEMYAVWHYLVQPLECGRSGKDYNATLPLLPWSCFRSLFLKHGRSRNSPFPAHFTMCESNTVFYQANRTQMQTSEPELDFCMFLRLILPELISSSSEHKTLFMKACSTKTNRLA